MITAVIATTAIGSAIYKVFSVMSEKEEQKRKDIEFAENNQMYAQKFEEMFQEKFFSSLILIDTTIWMDRDAKEFFQSFLHLLLENNKQVYLCTAQLNELENKKRNTKYGQNDNAKARMALNRIEKFQLEGRIKIGSLKIDDDQATYADPELIKAIKYMDKQGKQTTLITSDRTLRIRTRQFIDNECDYRHNVIGLGELSKMYNGYFEHYKISIQTF